MKISVQQYANALYEATKEKSQGEIDSVLENFIKILAKNNQLRLKNSIIGKFGSIYNQENGIVEARVTSREVLSNELRNKVRIYVRTKYGAKEAVLVEKVDESIKGGIIIQVGDEVMDGSVGRQLKELKKELRK